MLEELLRINPEPCQRFDDRYVHELLTGDPVGYLDFLLTGLRAVASGEALLEQPPKQLFTDPGERSDFRVMPCVVRYPDRVCKTVKIIGTNWPRTVVPGEISVGRAFALHPTENFIAAEFAGCILSSARTGACAATVIRLLRPRSGSLAVVGAGRVGFYGAFYAASLGAVRQVCFCDRDQRRAGCAASELMRRFPGVTATVGELAEAHRAGLLLFATDSEAPLFDPGLGRPSLVISVGADTVWQREIDGAALPHYALYVDSADCLAVGDLRRFRQDGLLPQDPPDLTALLTLPQPPASALLFISTGSALFDNLTIDYLLRTQL